jgi:hypothetical protein
MLFLVPSHLGVAICWKPMLADKNYGGQEKIRFDQLPRKPDV